MKQIVPVAAQESAVPVELPVPTSVQPAHRPAPVAFTSVAARESLLPQPGTERPAPTARMSARSRTQFGDRFPEPTSAHPAAWLLGETGFGAGQWFPLDVVEYWIGGLENNHLQITSDPTVSGNHACIVFETGVLGIFDHGSTNGTRVNDDLVQEHRRLLQPGDRIRIGRSVFVLRGERQPGTSQ